MKILIITSASAYSMAKEIVERISNHDFIVYRLKIPVASLATTSYIASEVSKDLTNTDIRNVDLVIIPGLVIGDASVIKDVLGVRVIKGPRYLGDLPLVIKYIEKGFEFSTSVPADDIIKKYLDVEYGEKLTEILARGEYLFNINDVKIPLRPPPLLLAYEVLIKEGDTYEDVIKRVDRASKLGTDIVVVGLPIGSNIPIEFFEKVLNVVKHNTRLPVGIDIPSLSMVRDIDRDLFDIIMNVSPSNLEVLSSYTDKVVVLIPEDTPSINSIEASLRIGIENALKLGFKKIIVDALLRPPQLGLMDSLVAFYNISRKFNYPLLMGLSNVYELIDADSHSIIALLTSIAIELGASILLVTEESRKSKNALGEAIKSREMIYRAYIRKSPPINVGVDMLIIKDKESKSVKPPKTGISTTKVFERKPPTLKDLIYFKIYVDEDAKEIVVDVYDIKSNEQIKRYVGVDALALGRKIIEEFPEVSAEHYLYLGYELSKAEIALNIGKSYTQDHPLFNPNSYK